MSARKPADPRASGEPGSAGPSEGPQIHPSVYVAQGVQVYGRVSIARGSSLWPNAVIRAEAQYVEIGRYTNIQDFAMLHVGFDHPTRIGDFCSITHHATVHGAVVEDACLIGIGAVIMDGAVIGKGSVVAGGAVVPEGSRFEPGSIIAGVPARAVKQRDHARANRVNAWQYHRNAACTRQGFHRAWHGEDYEIWLAHTRSAVEADQDLSWDPDGDGP